MDGHALMNHQIPKHFSFYERIKQFLFSPVDLASLCVFRVFCGLILLWEIIRYVQHGWVEKYYIRPNFNFKYWGFEWVEPLPGIGMWIVFSVLAMAALGILFGLFYRFFMTIFFIGWTYIFLLERCRYLNHFYMLCLLTFLMIFVPANHMYSMDRYWLPSLKRQRKEEREVGPAWSLWLIRGQVFVVYFFGGIAKLNSDWLIRAEPIRGWVRRGSDIPLIGEFLNLEWTPYVFAYGGFLLDLTIVPFLLWRKTRYLAFLMGLFFHLMNVRLFHIGIFPWFMILANFLFFSPSWPRKLVAFLKKQQPSSVSASSQIYPSLLSAHVIIVAFIGYFTFQLLLPLRHYIYPGNVHWTEEGHLFSWHMKIRVKKAYINYLVVEPITKKKWLVDPANYLPYWQTRKMRSQPELILQFAHYLQKEFALKGYQDVEVYAWGEASLHKRAPQPLVNESVDLTKVESSIWPASWIVPLKELSIGHSEMTSGMKKAH